MFTEIVGHPGSLYFTGVLHSMMALTCSVKKAFLFTLKPLFTMHRSFKIFSYVGTCLIISRRGMLTFTCRSTSKIRVWLTEFFFFRSACGKGGGTLCFTSSPAGCSSSGGSTTVGAFFGWFWDCWSQFCTTSQSYYCFNFINSCIEITGRAYFMHSPRILLCLGREFPFFRTLLLVRQLGNGTLQVVIFFGDLIMHIVYFLVE